MTLTSEGSRFGRQSLASLNASNGTANSIVFQRESLPNGKNCVNPKPDAMV